MKLMVFDVGGTEIKYCVMDDALNRTDTGSRPTPKTTLADFIETLKKIYMPHKDEVEGIAVSLPGFIDQENGVVRGGGALEYNWGQPVGQELAKACGCKVVLENDGKAAAMAELASGSLKGCQNASVFIIGTGVGGGIIVNGKVVRGKHGTAGEFSFINADMNYWTEASSTVGDACSTRGLLGNYKSKMNLPENAPIDGRIFFNEVHSGNEVALKSLNEIARAIAIQAYNLTALLDIEKLAIGGGISKQAILIDKINEAYDLLMATSPLTAFMLSFPRPEIVPCHYSSEANQIGAFFSFKESMGL